MKPFFLNRLPSIRSLFVAGATIIIFLTTIFVLMISLAVFVSSSINHGRRTAQSLGRLVSDNCSADLYFSNKKSSVNTLKLLESMPEVRNVIIYDAYGNHFASLDSTPAPDLDSLKNQIYNYTSIDWSWIHILQPVYYGSVHVGTVYVKYSLDIYKKEFYRYLIMTLIISSLLLVLAIWSLSRLSRLIARPLLQLAEISEKISTDRVFDVHQPVTNPLHIREVVHFISAFQIMIQSLREFTRTLEEQRQQLEESKQYFQSLFQGSPDAIVLFDESGRLVDGNQQFIHLFRYNGAALSRLNFPQLFHDQKKISEWMKMQLHSTHNPEIEEYCVNKEGRIFPAIIRVTSLYLKDNIYYLGIITDNTRRKKAEEEIIHLKNQLNNIIESMPSALIGIRRDNTIHLWNREASRLFSIPFGKAMGSSLIEVLPFMEKYEPFFQLIHKSRTPQELLRESVVMDNSRKIFDLYIFPIPDSPEKDIVIRIDDVTDIVQQEEQLQQAQKMETIGTLAGGIAHDFNNILGAIMGNLSLLEFQIKHRKEIPLQKMEKIVNDLLTSTERASEMVKQLLTLARRHELNVKPVNLTDILDEVKKICEVSLDKSIHIDFLYDKKERVIIGDEVHLSQVLLNICINAAHAMTIMRGADEPWGGTLTVKVTELFVDDHFRGKPPTASAGNYFCIEISDTGVGIDEQNLTRIFDPFFTTKPKGLGSGLGLAMCYYIISKHNGFITVQSEKNKGTTFSIYIPQNPESMENISAESDDVHNYFGRGNILIVDDEESIRNTAESILTIGGYTVDLASDGNEALKIYTPGKYDLVILDLLMPGISGKETFLQLKKIDPHIRVLLSTGFPKDKRVEDILREGALDVIAKPFTMKTLLKKIHQLLNSSR